MRNIIKQKKGEGIVNVIFLIGILFLLLIGGLFLAFGSMIMNWVFDESVPDLTSLGMVGPTNLTQISGYTITPVNSIVQSFTWLTGVVYILALMGCFGLAVMFRMTGSKWLMGFFIACVFLLVVASIFISNIYEEFYNSGDEVGSRLHEHTLLSWLILYSPMIMCIIAFICGVIMFTGDIEEAAG